MTTYAYKTLTLTHQAIMTMLDAGVKKAEEINQPQCIVIVDFSGETLGQIRMTGAKYLSLKSANTKARTAASIGAPTHQIPEKVRLHIAAATEGNMTGLGGGLPIYIDNQIVGGIGVGSGSPDQDISVCEAAISSINAVFSR